MLFLKTNDEQIITQYPISSAKNGLGEKQGSEKTPRGAHTIFEKIGENRPILTVFRARIPTGEIYSDELGKRFPNRDWILSRILWLSGTEMGFNCGGDVDTKSRFIYIHGTGDEKNMGIPNSHGCIRMRNQDVIALFNWVKCGTFVV